MRKNLNGQGSIRQRPDGRWEGRLSRESGERISVYGATATEAQRKLNAKIREAEQGIPEPRAGGRLTVGQYLEEWLEGLKASPRLRPSSWQNYANLIRVRLIPGLGHIRLVKLTYEDLEGLYSQMHREGCSRSYIRITHALMSTALRAARRKHLISGDPAGLVELRNLLPKARSQRRRALTLEELIKVLDVLRGHAYQAFFTTALLSGLRFGELAALRWQDVDLETGVLRVERGMYRITNRTARDLGLPETAQVGDPKSETSIRAVAIPAEVSAALEAHKTNQRERFMNYGRFADWSDAELVFQNTRFHAASQTEMNRSWHRLQDAAGIARDRHIPLHGTRSTFASLEVGARQERVTQERLGHSSATMTRHYQSVWDQAANVRNIEETLVAARAKVSTQTEAQ